ncbi:hypothetical protein [Antarctobacter jejuensis]|uniref:hypothetical protein n=1 Tax=Antarctobacter jejuensis TaxID=1439938 RepID=UPI003FD317E9
MRRILIHPGFHKTGTTSLQRGAQAQKELLDPRVRLILPHDMEAVNHAARRCSLGARPKRVAAFVEAAEALAETLAGEKRPVLISSEHLCGLIPGRKSVRSYAAAPELVARFAGVVAAHVPGAELSVWFSTRAPEAWLRSVYWQNLRGSRITEDLEAYATRMGPAAELDAVVAQVVERLKGMAEVRSTPLEAFGDRPLGPLGVALDLLGVSTEGLVPLPLQNVQPTAAAGLLLSLNRSDLDDEALAEAKAQALRRFLKSGQTKRKPPS